MMSQKTGPCVNGCLLDKISDAFHSRATVNQLSRASEGRLV